MKKQGATEAGDGRGVNGIVLARGFDPDRCCASSVGKHVANQFPKRKRFLIQEGTATLVTLPDYTIS